MPQQTADRLIFLSYQSSRESIQIASNRISHSKIDYFFSQPQHASPDSSVTHKLLINQEVHDKRLRSLLNKLLSTGFWDLDDHYGAPETERHYATSIDIRTSRITHRVIFRSNPSYSAVPQAFRQAEQVIRQFAADQQK
ncbi:MAG: hypothetical protein AAF587_16790 [Bacteroidota bacterium]